MESENPARQEAAAITQMETVESGGRFGIEVGKVSGKNRDDR